jgi:hypothetical protein
MDRSELYMSAKRRIDFRMHLSSGRWSGRPERMKLMLLPVPAGLFLSAPADLTARRENDLM